MDWTYFSRFGLGNTLSYNSERQHEFGPGNFALSFPGTSLDCVGREMYNHPITGFPLSGSCGPRFGNGYGRGYNLPPGYGFNGGFNNYYGYGAVGPGVGLGPLWGFGQSRGALGPAIDGFTAGLFS